jgi:ABC-type transport system involved in cytochrome bd biosynthesis fused ATPase/permease subunit
MFEGIKKWRELEYEARRKVIKNIGKDDETLHIIQQDSNIPHQAMKEMKEALVSANGVKKPSFFEAFFQLYPYSISLSVLGIFFSASFVIITQNIRIGLILIVTMPIILNFIYIKITTNKIKKQINRYSLFS